MEHEKYREWLDLEVERELPAELAGQLAEHLASCGECRTEGRRLLALRAALGEARIPVREGFRRGVMKALPQPSWQSRQPSTPTSATSTSAGRPRWWLAAALLLVLAGVSSLLFVGAGSDLAPSSPLAGAAALAVEMMGAALLTGAGLLAASWTGVGMAVGELFASAPGTLVAFAVLLLFLSLLLVGLLRRPRAAEGVDAGGEGRVGNGR